MTDKRVLYNPTNLDKWYKGKTSTSCGSTKASKKNIMKKDFPLTLPIPKANAVDNDITMASNATDILMTILFLNLIE